MKHITLALVAVAFVSLSTVNAAVITDGPVQKQCCDKAKGEKKPDDTKKD